MEEKYRVRSAWKADLCVGEHCRDCWLLTSALPKDSHRPESFTDQVTVKINLFIGQSEECSILIDPCSKLAAGGSLANIFPMVSLNLRFESFGPSSGNRHA